jgi:hypothetical protein
MAQNTTNYSKVLKERYGPLIMDILNQKVKLLNALSKGDRDTDGKYVKFPVHTQRNNSAGYISAGGTSKSAGNQGYDETIIPYRDMGGFIEITGKVMLQSKSKQGAFAKAVTEEIQGMVKDMLIQANRAAWGDGTGKIAEVDAYNSGTGVLTLKNLGDAAGTGLNSNAGNRYIRVGDKLDFYTSGAAVRNLGAVVTARSTANDTVTLILGSGSNPAASDSVYFNNPDGDDPTTLDPMGIGGIVDDGTYVDTLHNISRTTQPMWKAQVINVGSGPTAAGSLTTQVMQRLEDMLSDAGYGDKYTIWCHASVRTKYLDLMDDGRRYIEPYVYDPGFKEDKGDKSLKTTLNFNGHPIIQERDCPWQTMFFVNDVIKKWTLGDLHWVEDDGGGVLRQVAGKFDDREGQVAWYYNLGPEAEGPSSCGALRFISAAPDRVEPY